MKQADEKQTKPVIKKITATRSDLGVSLSQNHKRQVMAFTIIKIAYEDNKRTPFDGMVKGTFLGGGDDFFVMQDGDLYKLYDDSAEEIGSLPLTTGKFSGCQPYGFCLKRADETMSVFDKNAQEIGIVPPEFLKRAKKRADGMITKFWLSSPNPMTGMFWIRYEISKKKYQQYPVFLSIRDLFTLFKLEGVDPLVMEEDPDKGYYFKKAALQNLGAFMIETSEESTITVVGVAPYEGETK
ncbi:MAG: hypothetical protein WCP12_04685 [bacterium]